jgi:hypothetical protein
VSREIEFAGRNADLRRFAARNSQTVENDRERFRSRLHPLTTTDCNRRASKNFAGFIAASVGFIDWLGIAGLPREGVVAALRREKGHDIAAACGQLRLQIKRAEGEVRRMTA